MADHKGHLLACDVFGGDYEITLNLSVCRVKYNNKFAVVEGINRILDTVEAQLRDAIGRHLVVAIHVTDPSRRIAIPKKS